MGDDDDGGGGCGTPPNGLAGKENFVYECSGPADPHCDGAPPSTTEPPRLPRSIARGARFRLQFVGSLPVVPISDKAVESTNGEFTALRAGGIGLVVVEGAEAVDAVRFDVVEPQKLAIEAAEGSRFRTPGKTMKRGERRTFRAVGLTGRADLDDRLAGTLPITWSVAPSALAQLEQKPDGTCDLVALAPGDIHLRAAVARVQEELTIRIDGLPVRDAGSDPPRDGSADGSTDGGDE